MTGIVQKLCKAVIHGAGTSFLIDLPYNIHPQAAKQGAKLWCLPGKNLEMKTYPPEY